MQLKNIFAAVVALAMVCSAGAQEKKKKALVDEFSGAGYGLAGCGLGSIIFGPKSGIVQIPAATTNGWAGTQTFGISSGTSNCDIPKSGQTAAAYLEVNKEVVLKEASRGNGETLANLSLIYNCTDSNEFSMKVQANYKKIFSSNDSYEQSRQMINTIQSDEQLSNNCKI